MGLTPKVYSRIQRFHGVLRQVHASSAVEWADVACRCGYYDQAHFVRDFQEFAGLNPTHFLRQTVGDPKFIPLDDEG